MLRTLSLAFMALLPFLAVAQKTALEDNNVTFEKSQTSIVSYSGIGAEIYKPAGIYQSGNAKGSGVGISYEVFHPFAPKTAVTMTGAFKYFSTGEEYYDYTRTSVEWNIGLHQILFAGFYIKPQVGFGSITQTVTFEGEKYYDESAMDGIYGAQTGYLFKLNTERPKFIDVGLMYQGYFAGGSYIGIAVKYLLGPKNSEQ